MNKSNSNRIIYWLPIIHSRRRSSSVVRTGVSPLAAPIIIGHRSPRCIRFLPSFPIWYDFRSFVFHRPGCQFSVLWSHCFGGEPPRTISSLHFARASVPSVLGGLPAFSVRISKCLNLDTRITDVKFLRKICPTSIRSQMTEKKNFEVRARFL
jgi:hypothetical protein